MTATTDTAIIIRRATEDDAPTLRRLAQLDGARLPEGELLVAEADGEIRAALRVSDSVRGRPVLPLARARRHARHAREGDPPHDDLAVRPCAHTSLSLERAAPARLRDAADALRPAVPPSRPCAARGRPCEDRGRSAGRAAPRRDPALDVLGQRGTVLEAVTGAATEQPDAPS